MIREHYAAVLALVPPSVTVYLWDVPEKPEYPYLLLWGKPGDEPRDTLDDEESNEYETRIKATYAGLSGDSVVGIMQRCRAAINGHAPEVEGWRAGELFHQSLTDIIPDESVTLPKLGHPLFAVDEYHLQSSRIF